jgi:hypothetical protein
VYELDLGAHRAAEPEAHHRAEAEGGAEEVHRSRAAVAAEEGVEAAWSMSVTELTLCVVDDVAVRDGWAGFGGSGGLSAQGWGPQWKKWWRPWSVAINPGLSPEMVGVAVGEGVETEKTVCVVGRC